MYRRSQIGLLLGLCLWTRVAAEPLPILELNYERVLLLAREQGPALLTARARVREVARGVDAASAGRFNPELSGAMGPRTGPDETTMDGSIAAQQWLELGGQRGKRVEAARAAAAAMSARGEDLERQLLRDASLAFVAALYREQRVELAEENLRIAEAIAGVASQRHQVGDVGGLEQAVTALAVVRAQGDVDRARGSLAVAEGRLKGMLGIEASTSLALRGDLRHLFPDGEHRTGEDRPDLLALQAEIRKAEVDAKLGRAQRIPNIAVGAGYAREESADIVKGTFSLSLPFLDRGQGEVAQAEGRQERLRAELDAARRNVAMETSIAGAALRASKMAAERFEEQGLPLLERAEALVAASYEAGAIPLAELLFLRRELVQAKTEYVDLLLGAATARVEAAASAGTLR